MTALLPALLAGTGAVVLVGLPAPRRLLATTQRTALPRLPGPALFVLALVALVVPLGVAGACVGAVLAVVGRRAYRARQRARERQAEVAAAAEAMAVLAAELRAGRPPSDALRAAAGVALGACSTALAAAAAASGVGGAPAEALLAQADGSAAPDLLRGLAVCWQVCEGSGASLALAVDQLEDGLREAQAARDEVESELAGPRSTALVLAVLPVFGLFLGSGLGAHPVQVLLHTLVGNACLVLGVALDLLGLWWTGRIVRAAQRGAA